MAIGMPHFHSENLTVLRLVRYGALTRFHACVYDMCQHGHARTCRSSLKHLSMLIRVAYIGKPVSLGNMDQNNHRNDRAHNIA